MELVVIIINFITINVKTDVKDVTIFHLKKLHINLNEKYIPVWEYFYLGIFV